MNLDETGHWLNLIRSDESQDDGGSLRSIGTRRMSSGYIIRSTCQVEAMPSPGKKSQVEAHN